MDAFRIIKISFSLFGTKLARNQQYFLGFVHSIAKKKHEKVSKSSNADKNGLGEYQTMNFRHLSLS